MLTWHDLAARTLARQFAAPAPSVAAAVAAMGPIQTQVARSAYTGLASRRPGTTYDDVETAYRSGQILRGTSLRGTVHTVVAGDHPVLDAVTRRATSAFWRRTLGVEPATVQAEMESFAHSWRAPEDLRDHLSAWLASVGGPLLQDTAGRSLAHSHSGLVRRPVSGMGWDRRTSPEYAAATWLDPARALASFEDALDSLCGLHVRSLGPSAVADIAWWSGAPVSAVRSSLDRLSRAGAVRSARGPDGQEFFDSPHARVDAPDPGTRLLAEFDSLVCGYAPKNRLRFVDAEAREYYWTSSNGMYASVLLHDGRLRGSWKLQGTGKKRSLTVGMFPGQAKLGRTTLNPGVAALETALACNLAEVSILAGR